VKNFTISLAKDWALRWIRGSIESYFTSPTASTGTYLLALTARSLESVYCYLNCTILLKRFKGYSNIAEYELNNNVKSLMVKGT